MNDVAHIIERSSSVMIGRWSVHKLGLTLQVMIGLSGLLDCHMLSGLIQLPEAVL